jgi:pimeloyl-ACP methyl ester carboxylesterase
VLVHGLGGTWRTWGPTLDGLVRRLRVIAVDLPGFGRSAPLPGRSFELAEVGQAIAEALDELGVDEHALAGHSLGGGVSIAYAAARPERVSQLVLVAPAGLIATGAVRPSWRSPFWHRVGREATRLAEPGLVVSARLRRVALSRLVHDPLALSRRQVLQLVQGSRRGRSTGPAGIAIVNVGLRDRLHHLTMPTLVIWGDGDRVIGSSALTGLQAALPDARYLLLRETGHMPMIERPDEVTEAILELVLRS